MLWRHVHENDRDLGMPDRLCRSPAMLTVHDLPVLLDHDDRLCEAIFHHGATEKLEVMLTLAIRIVFVRVDGLDRDIFDRQGAERSVLLLDRLFALLDSLLVTASCDSSGEVLKP